MIAGVTGVLESSEEQRVTLTPDGVPGVVLEVMVPTFTALQLGGQLGSSVSLSTKLVIEAPSAGSIMTPRLIGFLSTDDRAFFELFTTVKGIGPRKALRAMAVSTGTIAEWIAHRDAKSLTSLPEIGKRSAETIVAELSGKVDAFIAPSADVSVELKAPMSTPSGGTGLSGSSEQAVLAMVRLGESQSDAERRVRAAIERDPEIEASSADAILAAALAV